MDPTKVVVLFRGALEVAPEVAARIRPGLLRAGGVDALLVAQLLSPGSVGEDDLTRAEGESASG